MRTIAYKDGYKYQLAADYETVIALAPPADADIATPWIRLARDGRLWLRAGYAWDGPSGPAIDTRTFMRGSLVHDALYQLMRERHLDRVRHRASADRILRDLCRADGMSRLRAAWVYWGVRHFADPAADPARDRPLLRAP